MMINFKTTLAAAAMMVLPMTASAVTVNYNIDLSQPDYTYSYSALQPGESVTFKFEATERLKIGNFGLSGSGHVALAQWQMKNPDLPAGGGTGSFDFIFGTGASAFGGTQITGLTAQDYTYQPGEFFQVTFTQPSASAGAASFTVSFPVAAVPVPAAGLLLLSALGGAAALRRRRKSVEA